MPTSLQAQLARIAANSANPLDLKVQRKAHSKSLLFEPKVAASQDFDTLYQICVQGFHDLCQVDARFSRYSKTIFSEQSKEQDRSQLTAPQNDELDALLEDFLSLVGGRLLLAPALKAIEWLIRRFRIHELNTQAVIYTFLPYHTEAFFLTLLSIVPEKLPQSVRFLSTYRENARNPPRQSIVVAAIQNSQFFQIFNRTVVSSAKRNHSYTQLSDFWSSVIAQALAGQLDLATTGRVEARRQKEDDVLLAILPTLNDGLSMRNPSLRRGSHMMMMILASRLQLPDRTLDAMMEAVTNVVGAQMSDDDLICLAALAKYRKETTLPKDVSRSILTVPHIEVKLNSLLQKYSVERLALGVVLAAINRLDKQRAAEGLEVTEKILRYGWLDIGQRDTVGKAVSTAIDRYELSHKAKPVIRDHLFALSTLLHASDTRLIQGAADKGEPEDENDSQGDDIMTLTVSNTDDLEKSDVSEAEFETKLFNLPDYSHEPSLLQQSILVELAPLNDLCSSAGSLARRWSRIQEIDCFHGRNDKMATRFLTFLMRFWCGAFRHTARRQAIITATEVMRGRSNFSHEDFQFVLPYAMIALSDSFAAVRSAAVDLVSIIGQSMSEQGHRACFGKDYALYTDSEGLYTDLFISAEAATSLSVFVTQHLEECVQDPAHIGKLLSSCLGGSNTETDQLRALNDEAKEEILSMLAAHTIYAPTLTVKMKLLQLLHDIDKVKNKSKTTLLLPLLQSLSKISTESLRKDCQLEMLSWKGYVNEVAEILSASSKSGRKFLCRIITGSGDCVNNDVRIACLEQVKRIWPKIKTEHHQHEIATALFHAVWQGAPSLELAQTSEMATEILRSVSLYPGILCDLLTDLPALTTEPEEIASPNKRLKLVNGDAQSHQTEAESHINWVIQRWTFVLELVEGSQDRVSSDLVIRLCMLLNDLHSCGTTIGSKTLYLQSLLLDSCNGAISDLVQKGVTINPNIVPVESIIDIFKTSTNVQVQQAALLLISTLAKIFPDVTVHHIMPVFTKMGESVLQHSDEYSVHVSNLAISTVIPPLLASFDQQKGGSQEGMVRLLVSFVAAFEHMPYDRRLPLFLSLVQQLGPANALHLLVFLFLSKFGRNKSVEDFVAELFSSYDAVDQLGALKKVVDLISNAVSEYPSRLVTHILPSSDARNRSATIHQVVALAARLTQDINLFRKASQELWRDGSRIRSLYSQLSEQTLRFCTSVRDQRKLSLASEALMGAILKLLPVHESISGLETLLSSGEDVVIRRTVKSIEDRVRAIGTGDTASQGACLELLPILRQLLQTREDQGLLQLCISCLDSIIDRFGKRNASLTKDALQTVASKKFITSADARTVQISLLCLASAIQNLGEAIVAILPNAVHLALEALQKSTESAVHVEAANASYAFFAAVLDSLPWVLTKANITDLLRISADVASSPSLREATLDSRAAALELLARKAELRDVLTSLTSTWLAIAQSSPRLPASGGTVGSIDALLQHLQVVRAVIDTGSKSSVIRYSQTLLAFFVQVFDLPSHHLRLSEEAPVYSVSDVEQVVDLAAENMVSMIFKLNDAAFRPLFHSLLDWANENKANNSQEQSRMARHFALYVFLSKFFGTLKSIVTSYAGLIVQDASSLLLQKSGLDDSSEISQRYEYGLWHRVLETLRQALDNDADEYFQAPTRFGPLCEALVTQIGQTPTLAARASMLQQQDGDDAQEAVEGHVIPTVVALASAADAAENAKALNKAVLKEMRNQRAEVRVSAARCQQMLVEKLGEDWLANLPEMLPVISEVLEDEDEEVVAEARRWVSTIEGILGESLEGMLQ